MIPKRKPMIKVGSLFFPWHEGKFTAYGDGILDYGQPDRDAAYKYVKRWRRALDVGANVGIFSCDFARRFDEVVAFEPIIFTRECLEKNAPPNVRIESCAISDEAGVLVMFRAGGSGNSFVLNHPEIELPSESFKSPPPELQAKTLEVEARTVDSFKFDAVDLIKLDIQGAEYVALLGARETILRHRPVILIEEKPFSDAHAESIKKTAELLVGWGMTPKEKVRTDRVYVFED
jgi:FkbM family methyltransferase